MLWGGGGAGWRGKCFWCIVGCAGDVDLRTRLFNVERACKADISC